MSKQAATRITAIALAATALVVLPAFAHAADKRTVGDARFDNRAVSKNGRIDIVEATWKRRSGTTRFTVTMRERVKPGRSKDRPGIFLNTEGGKRSDPEYAIFGSTLFEIRRNGSAVAIGQSLLSSDKRTWTFAFDPSQVKDLEDGYGWAAVTQKGKRIADIAPDRGYAKAR